MDSVYTKGELLKLVTLNSEFIGRFEDMDMERTKIKLGGVKVLPQGTSDSGMYYFYRTEILNIVKMPEKKQEINMSLKICQKDYDHITDMINKYRYINQVDENYYKALEDLNEYSYIAVGTSGAEMGRKCKLPFLTISTPNQIYIFDIQSMQYHAFDGGLKALLQSEYPKKIVHDCRKLSDCLKHKHMVELNSVFDTQVGDIIISKNKTGQVPNQVNSLQDCLRLYLGLVTLDEEQLDLVECAKRPLSTEIKTYLAKNVAYLHRLSEVINEELMLPYVRGVDCYINSIRSCDDFVAWDLCTKDKNLPKEFSNSIEY